MAEETLSDTTLGSDALGLTVIDMDTILDSVLMKKIEHLGFEMTATDNRNRIEAEDRLKDLNLKADTGTLNDSDLEELKHATIFLDKTYNNECLYWKQHAKKRWLAEGDIITKYFHLCASNRRRRNQISSISVSGVTISDWEEVAVAFRSVYVNLLGCKVPPLLRPKWLNLFHSPSTDLPSLDAPFTMPEVFEVIKRAKNIKATGPDGLTSEFYLKFWPLIGNQVLSILLEVQNNPELMTRINRACIVLIPKSPGANIMTNFRPISLENSIIKLFSKVLANRLTPLIPSLVDNKQGAFI
ncbi:hypothetical protein Cni_G16253 [Canna indica]|uniref:Reverse transcriptase domain-containing protein n=1 Tax=Canna indica TaxID=4628 RepID=A0AAQ3KKR1_9LILI|nr:hypothetical protein Cni_G16253 [Canna indica]